jgi:hypothetical protein
MKQNQAIWIRILISAGIFTLFFMLFHYWDQLKELVSVIFG